MWRLLVGTPGAGPSPVRPTTSRRPSYAVGVPNPVPNAKPILIADGWRKRSGPFYTRPLTPDALGVLALSPNRRLPYQWRLQPFVGIRHERVNALSGALVAPGWKSPYPEPTIRYRLVKLLDGPEARERDSWLIASEALDGNERVFREVADAARDVGLPWMQQRTGLDAIIYELENGNGTRQTHAAPDRCAMDERGGRRGGGTAGADRFTVRSARAQGSGAATRCARARDQRRFLGTSRGLATPRLRCVRHEVAKGHGAAPRRPASGLEPATGLAVPGTDPNSLECRNSRLREVSLSTAIGRLELPECRCADVGGVVRFARLG